VATVTVACPSTCYRATCDYWDGGYWGTCHHLESHYGCDCGGCQCDGCPQGKCEEDAPFDASACPGAGNAICDDEWNNEACAYDGGDCCQTTCVGTLCGKEGYRCKTAGRTKQENIATASTTTAEAEYNGDQAWMGSSPSSSTQNETLAAGAARSEWSGDFPGAESNGADRSTWRGDPPGPEHNGDQAWSMRSPSSSDTQSTRTSSGFGSESSGAAPADAGHGGVADQPESFMLLFGLSAVVVLLVAVVLTAVACRCMKRSKDIPLKTEELETVPGVVVTVVGAPPQLGLQDDLAAAAADEANLKDAQPDELCSTTSTAAPSELLEARSEVSACAA